MRCTIASTGQRATDCQAASQWSVVTRVTQRPPKPMVPKLPSSCGCVALAGRSVSRGDNQTITSDNPRAAPQATRRRPMIDLAIATEQPSHSRPRRRAECARDSEDYLCGPRAPERHATSTLARSGLPPIAGIDRLVAVGAHDRVHPHDSPTQTPASARGRRNSQVMGAATSNPPNLVAGVGWHQQQPLISAHRLPHRGSGIQFSDNLATRRSRRANVLLPS